MNTSLIWWAVVSLLATGCHSRHQQRRDVETQTEKQVNLAALSEGRFTTAMLAEISKSLGSDNFVINPFTVWAILVMLVNGAAGGTKAEIASLLSIDPDKSADIDEAYKAILNLISKKNDQVESKILNLVVNKSGVTLRKPFLARLNNVFDAKQFAVDFSREKEVALAVNKWASESTNQRITDVVTPGDMKDLSLLLGSAGYFKGKWKFPFPKNATSSDKFKNEEDAIISESVDMMRIRAIYNYTYLPSLESQVVDIPYDDETSLLVILPRRKVKLQTVLESMRKKSLGEILPPGSMTPEEVDLSLPKFSTTFAGVLNRPIYDLGVQSVLNPDAKLPKISDKAYISKVTHKAEIETNEEGSEASAVTTGHVVYKTTPISFQGNRPFLYFVNHTPTRVILFAGKYSQPRNN